MKRILSLAIAFTVGISVAQCVDSDSPSSQRSPKNVSGRLFVDARNEDGSFDLSQILRSNLLPDERKEAFKKGDKDKDGRITQDEYEEIISDSDVWTAALDNNAPKFGNDQGFDVMSGNFEFQYNANFAFPQENVVFKDDKLGLSNLQEPLPQERKGEVGNAENDVYEFLPMKELRNSPLPKFQFGEGEKPNFLDENNAVNLEKLSLSLKEYDKNSDDILDAEEQKSMGETVREKYQSLPFFINQMIGSEFQFSNQNFGKPQSEAQPWFGTPQFGDQPDFGKPQSEGQPWFGTPLFGDQPNFGALQNDQDTTPDESENKE